MIKSPRVRITLGARFGAANGSAPRIRTEGLAFKPVTAGRGATEGWSTQWQAQRYNTAARTQAVRSPGTTSGRWRARRAMSRRVPTAIMLRTPARPESASCYAVTGVRITTA